jgi:uncharacterized protein YbbC (DUF1343 family)
MIVCDRPNPIGGEIIEGPILEPGFESFIGPGPIPIRHGLTIGELARLYRDSWGVACNLTVVPCRGWRRSMWFDQTGLPWVPPSPGMPKLDTAVVYPGTCLFEGTNLSEGRGTTTPFETIGAPWLDGWALADALNARHLPGVKFRPVQFQPTDSKWQGQLCNGVQLHVLDRTVLRPVEITLQLLTQIKMHHPHEFGWRQAHFDRLAGSDQLRRQLEAGEPVEAIIAGWQAGLDAFKAQCRSLFLYEA